MHFSKTYTELLLSLPPELRNNAIEYRKLKKLINEVVRELTDLGLSPDVLHQAQLETRMQDPDIDPNGKGKGKQTPDPPSSWLRIATSHDDALTGLPRVVYEINTDSDHLEPRLRVLMSSSENKLASLPLPLLQNLERLSESQSPEARTPDVEGDRSATPAEKAVLSPGAVGTPGPSRVTAGGSQAVDTARIRASPEEEAVPGAEPELEPVTEIISPSAQQLASLLSLHNHNHNQEVIISLPSDTAFFQMLMQALQSLSTQLGAVADDFMESLHELAGEIALTARPISATSSSFKTFSSGTNAATVRVPSTSITLAQLPGRRAKSDLYQWREVLQLYIDMEIFESQGEQMRGERSVEDCEERLEKFRARLMERGYLGGRAMRMKASREALDKFMKLNVFILDLKKFQYATTEATRKILKKHTKRTALPVSPSVSSLFTIHNPLHPSDALVLTPRQGTALSLLLIQAVGETLLPIVPHIDDYACVICTSIAFKPIRLHCGHLFCVRCLVKMQKRGKGDCPMCRAPTVLQADRSNVDWALLNFMRDWFPIEARQKLLQGEKEVADEQMRELGWNTNGPACVVM